MVIFVLFLALLSGLFEMTRVFRTKHVLNNATFVAARAGALNDARLPPMNAELANDTSTLFPNASASALGLGSAMAQSRKFAAALRAAGGGIQIVSPTRSVFKEFNKQQYLPDSGSSGGLQKIDVIPNDNLRWRSDAVASVNVDGQSHDMNLQDANLLKIRTLWCHRLIVPALDRVIYEIINLPIFRTPRQSACNNLSGGGIAGVADGYYLAVTADATLRMQTPVVEDDLP